MPTINCTPTELADLSRCFLCLTEAQREAAKTYLMALIAGGSTDPTTLMSESACFQCLSVAQLRKLQPYLLCLINNGGVIPPPVDCAALSGSGDPTGVTTPEFSGQLYLDTVSGAYYRSTGTTSADWTAISSGVANVTSGLINWWKMDEGTGTAAADSAGSATGSFVNTPLWGPSIINDGLTFNGTNNYLQLAQNIASGSAFTVSAWVNPFAAAEFIYDSDGDATAGFWLSWNSGIVSFRLVGSSADLEKTSTAVVSSGVFTHILATWDGTSLTNTTAHLYKNAVEVAYSVNTSGAGTHSSNVTTDRFIGRGSGFFSGMLDDVRVYNRVLTPAEITQLFQWRGNP